jgi:hypothetical protein
MHVRSSGDPVEITGERDNLTINCDISECTHATTHTVDVPMRNAHPRQEEFEFICRFSISMDCAKEAGCLEAVNWHMHLPIFAR